MKKFSLSVLAMFMCFAFAFAQEPEKSEPHNNWELGVNVGVANFAGEYNMFKEARFNHINHWNSNMNLGFGLLVKKNFSHVFAVEGAWNYSNLTGSWKFDNRAMPDFHTRVNEFDVNSVWNINNLFSKNKFERKIYWYAKIGLGIANLKAITAATPLNDQHWKFPTIPLGTGVAFRLNENLRLNIGTQWSWINTDRLDGRRTDMTSGNVKAGNSEADIFGTKLYTHVGLSYTFRKKKKPVPVVIVEPAPIPEPIPEPKPVPKVEVVPEVVFVQPAVVGNTYKIEFGLNFGFDKYNLDGKSSSELDRLVKDLIDNPTVDVEITAHTDCRGAAAYNMTLSEKRGKSVKDYLIGKGISASRIKVTAMGETMLTNKCADGVPCTKAEHAANRRAEATIVIWKKE